MTNGSVMVKFLKAFIKATHKERVEFFKYVFQRVKERFIDYWLGYVSVNRNYIYKTNGEKQLKTFSIIAGKHGKGQWFSQLDANNIQTLIDTIRNGNTKYFNLHVSLGCSAYQEYTFDKRQTKLLLQQLEQIVDEEEIYVEDQ